MSDNLHAASIETLQQRLLEELEAQQRLHEELAATLESERSLRLENDLLWAYLQRKHPTRVKDAKSLLNRLSEGGDLAIELQKRDDASPSNKRSLKKRIRGALGKLPGVHRTYHSLKNLGK
ncbi:MAG TPA: hypothetical protein VIG71_09455 [Enteractinococcus sp.]